MFRQFGGQNNPAPFESILGTENYLEQQSELLGVNAYNQMFRTARVNPVSAISLNPEELKHFKNLYFSAIEQSRAAMLKIHNNFRHYEMVLAMEKRLSGKGDDAPSYTSPLSRNKAEGFISHIKDAIEQSELFSFTTRSVGSLAHEGRTLAGLFASYLEREVILSNSREIITTMIPSEVAFFGTAIVPISVSHLPVNGEYFFQVEPPVPLTSFFVDRIDTWNIWQTNPGYVVKYRLSDLFDMAERGMLDYETILRLGESLATHTPTDYEAKQGHFINTSFDNLDNRLVDVRRAYFRYRPLSGDRVIYFQVYSYENTREILGVSPNPYAVVFNAPPLAAFRIGKRPNRFFGEGIIERLLSTQDMLDNEINNYFTISGLQTNPPLEVRNGSPFALALTRNNNTLRGIKPGLVIPKQGLGSGNDVTPIQFDVDLRTFFGNYNLLKEFGDKSSFSEEALGTSSDSRKTLGQFQAEAQRGLLRVRKDLAEFAYDASVLGEMLWSCCIQKIKSKGIVEIYEGGKYLAYNNIPFKAFQEIVSDSLGLEFANGNLSLEEIGQYITEFMAKLTNGKIPGVNRRDMTVTLKGTKVIADKMAEGMVYIQLTPYLTSLLPLAEQNSYANKHLRAIFESFGIKDTDHRLPPDPNQTQMDMLNFVSLAAPFMEFAKTTSKV